MRKLHPHEPEFLQAVHEVAADIFDYISDKREYREHRILRRIVEPDHAALRYQGSVADARGVLRPAISGDLFSEDATMHTWGASLSVGTEF